MILCDNCHEQTINTIPLTVALLYDKKPTPFTKPRTIALCSECLMKFYQELEGLIQKYKVKIKEKV